MPFSVVVFAPDPFPATNRAYWAPFEALSMPFRVVFRAGFVSGREIACRRLSQQIPVTATCSSQGRNAVTATCVSATATRNAAAAPVTGPLSRQGHERERAPSLGGKR